MYRGIKESEFNIYNRIPSNAVQSYESYFLEKRITDGEFKELYYECRGFYENNFKLCDYFNTLPLDAKREVMYEWLCTKELPLWYVNNKYEYDLELKDGTNNELILQIIKKWDTYEILKKYLNPQINTKFNIKTQNYELLPHIVANPQIGVYIYFIVKKLNSTKISHNIYNAVKNGRLRLIVTNGNEEVILYNSENIDNLDLENIVKKICQELKVSQKELAESIGISENTIGAWARGITETPKWAYKIFELLRIEKKYNKLIGNI